MIQRRKETNLSSAGRHVGGLEEGEFRSRVLQCDAARIVEAGGMLLAGRVNALNAHRRRMQALSQRLAASSSLRDTEIYYANIVAPSLQRRLQLSIPPGGIRHHQ